jgi:hypothetical protein
LSTKRCLISLAEPGQVGVLVPIRGVSIEVDPPILPHVVGPVRLAEAEQHLGHALEGPVRLARRGECEGLRQVEGGQTGVGHQDVAEAEPVHGADVQVRRIAQAQTLQASSQLTGAFLAVG